MKRKSSKKLAIVLILLALMVPIVLAALFLRENMTADLRRGTIRSVTLIYGEKTEELTDPEEIAFFVDAATGGASIQESAKDLAEYRNLKVVFRKFNRDVVYQFYLSDSENDCVYADPDGKLYLFPQEVARELQSHRLLENYALSFAEVPSPVLVQGGKEYAAAKTEGEWHYVRADGKNASHTFSESADVTAVLPQGEALTLRFSIEPDYCGVLLSVKDGELLYSGVYAEMPVVHRDFDTELTMTVTCDWYEKEGVSFHGSMTYTFPVFYDIPTLCTLEQDSAAPGGAFVLTVSHSSSLQLAVNATFAAGEVKLVKQGGAWTATIPVSENAVPGSYSLMVMGSDVDQTIPVTVLASP